MYIVNYRINVVMYIVDDTEMLILDWALQEFEPTKHNIDVMHIEKNICESLLKFLSGEKDTGAVRSDLQAKNIRPHLWLREDPRRHNVFLKFQAPYCCTVTEWSIFLARLSSLRTPTGYASSFKKFVKDKKLAFGKMKSHDFHVLMQQILSVCLRGLMEKPVRLCIVRLGDVFTRICTKVWDPEELPKLRTDVATLLCDLERYFPPAFFDVMTHLLIHVVDELDQFGPVSCRWMYPLERYMKLLKDHVRTFYRPEASMGKGYLKDETLGYMTEYLAEYKHVKTRVWNSDEEEGVHGLVLQGAAKGVQFTRAMRDIAHRYVLENSDVMLPWQQ